MSVQEQKPAQQEMEADEAPPTREEFRKVAELANALGANLRKEREEAAKRSTDLSERLQSLSEQLAAFKGGQPKEDAPADDKTSALEAKLREMEAKFSEERSAREREVQTRMQQEEKTALSQALNANGVTGAKLRAAMAILYTEDKRISRDEKGEIGFKVPRGSGQNTYEEMLPIEAGVVEWLKTDDGKEFAPPRNAHGSGTQPATLRRGQVTKEEKKAEALRQLGPLIIKSLSGG